MIKITSLSKPPNIYKICAYDCKTGQIYLCHHNKCYYFVVDNVLTTTKQFLNLTTGILCSADLVISDMELISYPLQIEWSV